MDFKQFENVRNVSRKSTMNTDVMQTKKVLIVIITIKSFLLITLSEFWQIVIYKWHTLNFMKIGAR